MANEPPRLPLLEDPEHPGLLVVKRIGTLTVLLVGGLCAAMFLAGSLVRLGVSVQGEGSLEHGPGRCMTGQGDAAGVTWCATLEVAGPWSERVAFGTPVRLVLPRGDVLEGRVLAVDAARGPGGRSVVVGPAERMGAPAGPGALPAEAGPIRGTLRVEPVSLGDYVARQLGNRMLPGGEAP